MRRPHLTRRVYYYFPNKEVPSALSRFRLLDWTRYSGLATSTRGSLCCQLKLVSTSLSSRSDGARPDKFIWGPLIGKVSKVALLASLNSPHLMMLQVVRLSFQLGNTKLSIRVVKTCWMTTSVPSRWLKHPLEFWQEQESWINYNLQPNEFVGKTIDFTI